MCVCGGGGERQIFKGVLNFLKTREGQIRVASGGVCVPCGGWWVSVGSALSQEERGKERERDHVCKLVFGLSGYYCSFAPVG